MDQSSPVIAVYPRHAQAEEAIRILARAGIDIHRLSILGTGYHTEERPVGFYTARDRARTWGALGAFWGSLWGLALGAAYCWITVDPLSATDPFLYIAAGAVAGAAATGAIAALGALATGIGSGRGGTLRFETLLRADEYLLVGHGTTVELARARAVLEATDPEHLAPDS